MMNSLTRVLSHAPWLLSTAVGVMLVATPALADHHTGHAKSGPAADELVWGPQGNRSPCAAVKCSKEQRQAFRQSLSQMQEKLAAAKVAMHALKAKMADILRAPNLDKAALDQVFADLASERAKVAEFRKTAIAEIFAQLTPEQRAKLADRIHRQPKIREVKEPPAQPNDPSPHADAKAKKPKKGDEGGAADSAGKHDKPAKGHDHHHEKPSKKDK